MRFNPFIVILFIFLTGSSYSQKDCFDFIENQTINESDLEAGDLSAFYKNIECFRGHDLDDTDLKIFLFDQTMISMLVYVLRQDGEELTYKRLHEEMVKLTLSDSYKINKPILSSVIDFFKLPADINNWEKDKQLLLKAGLTEKEAAEFEEYLRLNGDPSKTYKEVFDDFSSEMAQNNPPESPDFAEESLFSPFEFFDLEDIMTYSEEESYPVIFYFSSTECEECFMLEEEIEGDDLVYSRLYEEAIFLTLMTNDTTQLDVEEQYFSDILKKKVLTYGDKIKEFQLKYFKSTNIPSMYAMDSAKLILASLPEIKDTQQIIVFIDELKSQFYGFEEEPTGE